MVEHELDVIRHADWIVDVGPAAGDHGGEILYSGPLKGLESVGGIENPALSVRTAESRAIVRLELRENGFASNT